MGEYSSYCFYIKRIVLFLVLQDALYFFHSTCSIHFFIHMKAYRPLSSSLELFLVPSYAWNMTTYHPIGSYHTHSTFCDGLTTIEDMVNQAHAHQVAAVGISSHAPCPEHNVPALAAERFPEYLAEIHRLRELYKGSLEVYAALEGEFMEKSGKLWGSEYSSHLDYTIGSVHAIYHDASSCYLNVDGPLEQFEALLHERFGGRIQEFVTYYYKLQERMLAEHSFTFLGHCDLITKHNRNKKYFDPDESWYRRLTNSFLETVADCNVMVEVNTGGVSRGYTSDFYPSAAMRKTCHSLGIPMLVSSDAHEAKNVVFGFSQAFEDLKAAGYTHHQVLLGGKWESIEIGSIAN